MDSAAYRTESALESGHWWFRGRRRLFADLIHRRAIARSARVLDVGSGTGSNLRMLLGLKVNAVVGIDRSMEAATFARAKMPALVSVGDAKQLPFAPESFDLVLITDVIEHIDDDVMALKEVCAVLRPGGAALVTVPAFRSLWGRQDEIARHLRRYRKSDFCAAVEAAGFRIERCFHFNFVLFPLIWAVRRLMRALDVQCKSENELTPGPLNWLLALVFAMDVKLSQLVQPPFGVSLCIWAVRPAAGVG